MRLLRPDPPRTGGEGIAGGHAYKKHVIDGGEFPGVASREQFASLIEQVVYRGQMRVLRNGKTGYWREGTLVIRNPKAWDGGTAYRPIEGYAEFLKLGKIK